MQDLLRHLLSLRGVDTEPGTELRLELAGFSGGGTGLLVLAGAAALVVLVMAVYRREGRGQREMTRGRRRLLVSLRTFAVLFVLWLWLEPQVVVVQRDTREGHVIVLVDTSQSMAHRDTFRAPEVGVLSTAWRELGVETAGGVRRTDLLSALLEVEDRRLLRTLAARNEVHVHGFAGAVERLATLPRSDHPATSAAGTAPLPDLPPLRADGRHTNPGGALHTALERSRDSAVAAVVVLSDGRRTLGPRSAETARLLNQRKVGRTLILPVGDPSPTQAVAVRRIEAPEKVFRQDPFRIAAVVTSEGHPEQQRRVLLHEVPEEGPPVLRAEQMVRLGGPVREVLVEYPDLKVEVAGRTTFAVSIVPPDDEPADAERHRREAVVQVLGEQIRVLLVAGGPSPEYQIVRSLLTHDRTIRLACWLQSASADFPQDGNDPITALPTDASGLLPHDVVILMDPDSRNLPPEFASALTHHVTEGGAGLWFVAGEKFTLDTLRPTSPLLEIAEVLPVVADIEGADQRIVGLGRAFPRPWPYLLTPEGAVHPVCRLMADVERNQQLWSGLPGLHFAFPVQRLKPAASLLVGHGNKALATGQGPMPLIVAQPVGAGRVLFSGTDETYRWRSVAEEAFDRLWVKGVRYLFEGRLTAGNARLRVDLDATTLELGDPVVISAKALDETLAPLRGPTLELGLVQDDSVAMALTLQAVEGAPGRYQTTWLPPAAGRYRLVPPAELGPIGDVGFVVSRAETEREGPVDLVELAALAAVPGGTLLSTPGELLAAAESVPSAAVTEVQRTPHALWDGWMPILFLLSLLAAEWWIRKRANLL